MDKEDAPGQIYSYLKQYTRMLADQTQGIELDRYGNEVVPERPYSCSFGKSFQQASSWRQHCDDTGHR